jgi:hypothetical protein
MAAQQVLEVAVVAKLPEGVRIINHRGRKEYRTIKHRAHKKNVAG